MGDRPNYGYAAGLGAAGGFDSLHKLIAARQQQEEEAQLFRLRDEAAKLAERKLEEDTKYRQSIQEQNRIEQDQMQEYRDRVLAGQEQGRKQTLENQQIDNWRAALDNTPGGRVFDEEGYQRGVKAGYGPGFEAVAGEHALAPTQYKFKGGATWLKGEEDRLSREETRRLDRESQERQRREALALQRSLAELAQSNKTETGWRLVENPDVGSGLSWINASGGRRDVPGDTPLGAPGARASKNAAPMQRFIASLDALEKAGDANGWQGLGLPGAWDEFWQQKGLTKPPPEQIAVRAALADVISFVGHERYGAALTENEKKTLNSFISNVQTQGEVTREMIMKVRDVELDVMEDVLGGVRGTLMKHRGGGPEVTSIRAFEPGSMWNAPTVGEADEFTVVGIR